MTLPDFDQVEQAREVLCQHFAPTRLLPAPSLTRIAGAPVLVKLEAELPTGSFKVRGAVYALWSRLQRGHVSEVVASSTGNHGAAVAFAARTLGVPATIFLPSPTNPVKRQRIAELGARIVEPGAVDLAATAQYASAYAQRPGVYFLNDATDPDLPAGPATIACEILDQHPAVGAIVVPVGDTALIRGVAAAARHLRPAMRIVGVQAERAPSYYLSWTERRAIPTETCDTIADGLATRTPVEANVRAIVSVVDEMHLVNETELLGAVRHLLLEEHVIAEPAGAAAVAVLLRRTIPPKQEIVALVTGANVSAKVLQRALGTSA